MVMKMLVVVYIKINIRCIISENRIYYLEKTKEKDTFLLSIYFLYYFLFFSVLLLCLFPQIVAKTFPPVVFFIIICFVFVIFIVTNSIVHTHIHTYKNIHTNSKISTQSESAVVIMYYVLDFDSIK